MFGYKSETAAIGNAIIAISYAMPEVLICCLFNGANRNSDYDPMAANSKFKRMWHRDLKIKLKVLSQKLPV